MKRGWDLPGPGESKRRGRGELEPHEGQIIPSSGCDVLASS